MRTDAAVIMFNSPAALEDSACSAWTKNKNMDERPRFRFMFYGHLNQKLGRTLESQEKNHDPQQQQQSESERENGDVDLKGERGQRVFHLSWTKERRHRTFLMDTDGGQERLTEMMSECSRVEFFRRSR